MVRRRWSWWERGGSGGREWVNTWHVIPVVGKGAVGVTEGDDSYRPLNREGYI